MALFQRIRQPINTSICSKILYRHRMHVFVMTDRYNNNNTVLFGIVIKIVVIFCSRWCGNSLIFVVAVNGFNCTMQRNAMRYTKAGYLSLSVSFRLVLIPVLYYGRVWMEKKREHIPVKASMTTVCWSDCCCRRNFIALTTYLFFFSLFNSFSCCVLFCFLYWTVSSNNIRNWLFVNWYVIQ